MPQDRIDAALAYVQGLFETEYSGHDYFHTLRVFNMATRLAKAEGADVEIAQLAALLHDVDDRKISPETCKTKARAVGFLRENGADELVEGGGKQHTPGEFLNISSIPLRAKILSAFIMEND